MSNAGEKIRWMLSALLASGFIVSLWSLLGILKIPFMPAAWAQLAPLSLLGSVTGLGVFLAAMVPLIISAIFKVREGNAGARMKLGLTIFLSVNLVLNLFMLLALYSFVPWPAFLIGIVFFLAYILAQIVRPTENWTWLPMAVFVGVLTILMIGTVKIARIEMPIEVTPTFKLSWDIAKGALAENAIFGSGPGSYGFDFSSFKPQQFNANQFYNLRFYQGTGMFFEALPTVGLLGALAFLLLVFTYIGASAYLLSRDKEKNKIYSLGFLSATLILVVSAFITRIEGGILLIGSLLAIATLAVILKESDSEEEFLGLSLKASPKFALALAFVFMVVSAGVAFMFVFVGKVFVADIYAGSAVKEATMSEEGSIRKMGEAIRLYGREGRYFTRVGQEYMILANNEMLKNEDEVDVELLGRYIKNSIEASNAGKKLMENDVLAVEVLAQVYENTTLYVEDSLKQAEENYARALELEPQNPNFMIKLGQIKSAYAARENDAKKKEDLTKEANEWFEKAVAAKPNLSPAHYNLALAKEALKDLDGAIVSMEEARKFDPTNAIFLFNSGRLYQARGADSDLVMAEQLYKEVLKKNPKEINTEFSLGLLYEKLEKKDAAIAAYEVVLESLSGSQGDAKERIQTMIDNVRKGVKNNQGLVSPPNIDQADAGVVTPAAITPQQTPSLLPVSEEAILNALPEGSDEAPLVPGN